MYFGEVLLVAHKELGGILVGSHGRWVLGKLYGIAMADCKGYEDMELDQVFGHMGEAEHIKFYLDHFEAEVEQEQAQVEVNEGLKFLVLTT